jgi:uncharacterized protein (TIGR02300 family)
MKFLVADVAANPGETVSDGKQPRFLRFLHRLFGGGDELKPAHPAPPARKNRQSHAPKRKLPAAKKEPPSDKPAKKEPPSDKPAKKEPPSRDKPAKKVAAKPKAGTKPTGPPPAAPAEAPGKVPPVRGTKRVCPSCGARFYDLNRSPITCPVCQAVYQVTPPASRRGERAQAAETRKAEETEAEAPALETADVISLEEVEEAGAEAATEEDEEIVDLGDDAIPAGDDDEDEGEAVSGIVGGGQGKESQAR